MVNPARYCILCGNEIDVPNLDAVFCSEHAAPTSHKTKEWQPGDLILGTYQVTKKLGQGGFGVVYQAHHKLWNVDLAVKRALNLGDDSKATFITEAEHWIEMGFHPHIITCYYVRNIDGFPHTFAELALGGSLENWILGESFDLYQGDQDTILERMLDIAIQFAWGLAYAHERGLVHLDVKPQNALMTPEGVLKVTDFGLAKAKSSRDVGQVDHEDILVSGGAMTVAYRSPEQAARKLLSKKTDIWSWGVSVLEMFNGGVSWMDGQMAASTLESYLSRSEEEDIPSMPRDLGYLLRACFQADPQSRPESMGVIAEDLLRIYRSEIGGAYHRELPTPAELRSDNMNNKALTLLDLGREADAVVNWQTAQSENPQHLETVFNYGYYQWQRGEMMGSEFLARLEALQIPHQRNRDYWRSLAWTHLEQGNLEGIQQALAHGLVDDPALDEMIDRKNHPIGMRLNLIKGHQGNAYSVQLSPTGKFAVSGGADRVVILWDVLTGQAVHRFNGHNNVVCSVDVHPGGEIAVSGSQDKTIRIWDLKDKREERVIRGHKGLVWSVCFSHDGRSILSGGMDKSVRLWDVQTGKAVRVFNGHQESVTAACFSSDDRMILSGGYDKILRLWDTHSGLEIQRFDGHQDFISSLCFSPDGQHVLSSSMDRTICQWDIKSGKRVKTYSALTDFTSKIVFLPDGRHLLCANADATVRVIDTFTWREIRRLEGHQDFVRGLSVAKNGERAASCSHDGQVIFWQVKFPVFEPPDAHPYPLLSKVKTTGELQKSKNQVDTYLQEVDKLMLSGDSTSAYAVLRKALEMKGFERSKAILDKLQVCVSRGRAAKRGLRDLWLAGELRGHSDFVYGVAVSPDEKSIVSASRDMTLRLWDFASGKTIRVMQGHTAVIVRHCFDLSADGRFALSGGRDGTLRQWDLTTGEENLCIPQRNVVSVLCYLPSNQSALSGTPGGLSVWDLSSKRTTSQYLHPGTIGCVCCSKDGRLALSGSNNRLFLWDLHKGSAVKAVRTFVGHTDVISQCAFTANSENALSCSSDGTIRLWDVNSGTEIRQYLGHIGIVNDVVISPDDQYVFSAGADKMIMIWELTSGRLVRKFEAHKDGVFSISLSPSNRYLISGGADNTIFAWELDWDWAFPPR